MTSNNKQTSAPVAAKATIAVEETGASIISVASNLSSSIIGSGVLALSYTLSIAGTLFGSTLLIIAACIILATFVMLVRAARETHCYSYKAMAASLLGRGGIVPIEGLVVVASFGYCAMYVVIAADLTFKFLGNITDSIPSAVTPTLLKCLYGFLICAPLSLMRKISGFAPFSYAALTVVAYTICLIVVYFFKAVANDELASDIPIGKFNFKAFMSVPVFILAFGAAPAVPPLYSEIKGRNYTSMIKACLIGTLFCAGAYLIIGNSGLYTVGLNHDNLDNILLCLDNTVEVNIAIVGFVYVVLVSYPIIFYPCRLSVYNIIDFVRQSCARRKAAKAAGEAARVPDGETADGTPVAVELAEVAATPGTAADDNTAENSDSSCLSDDKDEIETGPATPVARPTEVAAADLLAAGTPGKENVADDVNKDVWYGWPFHIFLCFLIAALAIGIAIGVPSLGVIASVLGATGGVLMYFFVPTYFYLNARNFPWSTFHCHRAHLFDTDGEPFPHVIAHFADVPERMDKYAPPTKATFFRWLIQWQNLLPCLVLLATPIIMVVGLMSTFM